MGFCSLMDSFGQSPEPWYTPAWQWTVTASSNWIAKTSSGPFSNIYSPFQGNPSSNELQNIILAKDYLPEQGWVLLFKDFGYVDLQNPANSIDVDSDIPLFILYNKYTGTMRGFFHVPASQNFQHNSAVAKIFWASPTNTLLNNSLFTLSNNYPQPNSAYPKSNNSEAFFNYLQYYPTSAGWFTTEFKFNFDPNTNRNTFGQQIVLKFFLANTANVDLDGSFTFTTQSASALETPMMGVPNSGSPNTLSDYAVQAKKFLGKVPTKTDVQGAFTTIENNVNALDGRYCNNFTRDIHNMNNSLQNGALKKFLIGAAGFIPYVGTGLDVLATVLDLFSSKSNTVAATTDAISVQPTISEGHITLTGSITTQFSGKSLFIQVPGTKHKNSANQILYTGLPYYDCPLGVISLKRAPTVKKMLSYVTSTATQSISAQIRIGGPNFVNVGLPQFQNAFSEAITVAPNGNTVISRGKLCVETNTKTVVSYKLDEILELDLNLASDVIVTSAKVALMFEIQPFSGLTGLLSALNGAPSIDPSADHHLFHNFFQYNCSSTNLFPDWASLNFVSSNTIVSSSDSYINDTRKNLDAGILKLSNYDNVNKYHKFQTQFVDLNSARGLSASFEEGLVKVFVKILVVMKPNNPNDNQTPITKVLTYEITNFNPEPSNTNTYKPICEQLQDIENDAYLNASVCNGTNTTFSIGNKIGVNIANFCNVIACPGLLTSNSSAIWQADNSIKLRAPFKTIISGTDLFKAKISSTNLCQLGSNALQVNFHNANCDSDPSNHRLINPEQDKILQNGQPNNLEILDPPLKMSLLPNPNAGSFKVAFKSEHELGTITIFDNLSRIIWSSRINENEDLDVLLTNTKPGIYYLKFVGEKCCNLSQKLIIQ
jgi:hypothetical protein